MIGVDTAWMDTSSGVALGAFSGTSLKRNSLPGGGGGLAVVGQGGTRVEASNRSWEPTQEKRAVDELDDARDITQVDKEWT